MHAWKVFGRLLTAVFLMVLLIPARQALAVPDLSISVSAGLDSKTKDGEGAPVVFTIENKGSSFTGDLVFDTTAGQSSGAGRVVPVTVGQGEKQTVSMIVESLEDPNMYGGQVKKNVFLYENGWKSGKEIAHSGTQLVTSMSFPRETLFVAGLADNIDRLSSLKDIQLTGFQGMELLNLSKGDAAPLPSEAAGWGAVDIVAADRFAVADLTAAQQDAMLEWVKSGGILLLGASDNAAAEAGVFREYLPLELSSAKELPPKLFNDKFKDPVPGYGSALAADAKAVAETDGVILAAARPVNDGIVVQTSFTIGSDAFRSAIGAKRFWSDLLKTSGMLTAQRPVQPYYSSPADDLSWSVAQTNELFPSFKVSAPLLAGFILIYLFMAIPVLYVFLRKKDKREHAWWIIPAAAVAVSIAIFAYGAKDRLGKSQLQHSAIYEVGPDSRLSGYYVESLLTDKSGEFSFGVQKPSTVLVSSSMTNVFGGNGRAHDRAVVEKGTSEELLTYRNLGFWNVASFYGRTEMESAGSFDTDLTFKEGLLTGTVTNTFPFALDDVLLLTGSKKISLGAVAAGETISVKKEIKASVLGGRSSFQMGSMGQMAASQEDLMESRKEGLLEFSATHLNSSLKPVLAGVTGTQIMELALNGRKASSSPLSIVLQPVDIETVLSGSVKIDSEAMQMELLSVTGQPADLLDETTKEYFFYEDEYTQTWQLPENFVKEVTGWSSLQLLGTDSARYEVSILNIVSGEYEPLEGKSTLTAEPAGDYVSKEGKVTVKLAVTDNQAGDPVHPPELRLTGEAAK
ncbi:hypothetical protein NCCP2716_01390 [Sporosarcina sp. NCCP-2716]|uniref:hypothetical protein n=1 Tax=Sporosarcina sp. NCCP-2716 TaxID=2943679 RepID=UPI00203A7ED9|nr:hypothetical protein [Sporosarcina sp. NCCP-2716]GKV67641.1 hypothetical protein NCCP2716_01390 [Sporosarcina sp. NCCP-2716]